MKNNLTILLDELNIEVQNIGEYWSNEAVDLINGGFIGRIDQHNAKHSESDKGVILNARILWTFSSLYKYSPSEVYKTNAIKAYTYFKNHFIDYKNGGVYWNVDYLGNKKETKKQIYALAFAIYALSEYAIVFKNSEAKKLAVEQFHNIEEHAFDRKNNGYIEAFDQKWNTLKDVRLSKKDQNDEKTMNTHLHILEAYTNLYIVHQESIVLERIKNLITIFNKNIISQDKLYLNLFFNNQWEVQSNKISYGHDIEACWLMLQAAEVIDDKQIIENLKSTITLIAQNCTKGIDQNGALNYEYDKNSHNIDKDKHWWVQAEAMVGFYQLYQITRNKEYLNIIFKTWEFIKENIIDKKNGEWYWGVDSQGKKMKEDKLGPWKCPYHNTRACLELIKRINNDLKNEEIK